jgi:signal transduction histidine kinase
MTTVRSPSVGIELPVHLRAAGRTLLYLLLSVPYGLGYLLLAPLAAVFRRRVFWRLAEIERRQANRLLDAHMPPVPREHDRAGFYRTLALLVLRLPVTLVALVLVAAPVALAVGLLVLGVEGIGGDASRLVGPWTLGAGTGIALCLLAVPATVVAIATCEGVAALLRAFTRKLLRTEASGEGPVREMLAERLGDRSLNIAYWLPDREIFVDERGRPVSLPGAGSGRAWTAVEREGNRVAAIVHDAELDATPELVHAAASAAALALDNERLKADLRARLEELRHSRRRIVDAADDARRQIERDLHDGAQQQLVSLALDLRLLRARVRGSDIVPMVEEISDKLAVALAELRELARGIHPSILTDRGLEAALEMLAGRAGIPVDLCVTLDQRLPERLEAAAYYIVAEALTNASKYADASHVRVNVERSNGSALVEVADDGVGGADQRGGSGLRGLRDRVEALGGELALESPQGAGTTLTARLPDR